VDTELICHNKRSDLLLKLYCQASECKLPYIMEVRVIMSAVMKRIRGAALCKARWRSGELRVLAPALIQKYTGYCFFQPLLKHVTCPTCVSKAFKMTTYGMTGNGRSRWQAVRPRHLMCYEIFETRLEATCRRMQRFIWGEDCQRIVPSQAGGGCVLAKGAASS
jgi:hypothetical protein